MQSRKDRATVTALFWILPVIIGVVTWASVDVCMFLSHYEEERRKFNSNWFLDEVLMACTDDAQVFDQCRDQAEVMLNGATDCVKHSTSLPSKGENQDDYISHCIDSVDIIGKHNPDNLNRARTAIGYLWKHGYSSSADSGRKLSLQEDKNPQNSTSIMRLLERNAGRDLGVLCLYTFVFDQLGIDYQLLFHDRKFRLIIDDMEVDVTSPGLLSFKKAINSSNNPSPTENTPDSEVTCSGNDNHRVSIWLLAAAVNVKQACNEVRKGEYQKAINHCTRAMNLAPEYDTPYLNKGIVLVKLGRSQEAHPYFRKAVELAPERSSSNLLLGNCQYLSGAFEKALKSWEKAKTAAVNDGNHRCYELAGHNLAIGERESSFLPLERQVYEASRIKKGERVFEIGRAERQLEKDLQVGCLEPYERAKEIFTWAWQKYDFQPELESSSIDDVITYNRGNCATLTTFFSLLFKRFKLEPKVMMFSDHVFLSLTFGDRRVDIETTDPDGFDTSLHRNRPGIKAFELSILPGILYNNIAALYVRSRNLRQAQHYLEKSLETFPDNPLVHSQLSDINVLQRKMKEAFQYQEKAISMDPYYSSFYLDLALLNLMEFEFHETAICLQKALYFSSFDPEPDKVISKTEQLRELLFDYSNATNSPSLSSELNDLIDLPLGVLDKELFGNYATQEVPQGVYLINFGEDQQAITEVGLDDLLKTPVVMVAAPGSFDFREARRGTQGKYYYSDTERYASIYSGSRFYVPLELIMKN